MVSKQSEVEGETKKMFSQNFVVHSLFVIVRMILKEAVLCEISLNKYDATSD